ncbi:MAG TPA: indole-3-glycerol phosphate synthase TrpC [Thermoanaerobaculia bacterium]|nr:indole-3-glycerol phosphate synthase TrpC [Thermoanaerobaculia bacterium]
MTVLDQIVERTRARLATRSRKPHAFAEALSRSGVNVIAEIKSASPSAGTIVETPEVETIARSYRDGGAAAISIVTEPEFFRGDLWWLRRASAASGLPVIMKDFVVDPLQIAEGVAAGADAMLLLASLLTPEQIRQSIALLDACGCDALVEVHDEEELQRAIDGGARLIGVNNRDLRDFRVDLATSERLARLIPPGVIKIAESGIGTRDDVQRLRAAGFDAFLVGESLLRQNDRAAAVRRLIEGDD